MLVLRVDESLPTFARVPAENVGETQVEFDLILVEVLVQLLGAQDLSDAIVVVVSVEKRFFPENRRREHAAQRPHVVHLIVDQEFWTLEVSRGHSNVVLLTRMIELGQAPVDESKLSVLVIDHDVVGLDVAVHDAEAVAIVECLQQLVQVEADVVVGKSLIELLEVCVLDVFQNEGRGP